MNSALQRARARLSQVGVDPDAQAEPAGEQRAVVDRYVAAFEKADVAGLIALLVDDVVLEMSPMWNWFLGTVRYGGFIQRVSVGGAHHTWRTVPLWANGEAGFAAYADGELHRVQILNVSRGRVTRDTVYQDQTVFNVFGLDR